MSGYSYAVGDEAVHVFTSFSARQRMKLLRVFDHLARFPSQHGDYQEAGASGSAYEVKLFDSIVLTWWVDHAVKEVRIVRIESVD